MLRKIISLAALICFISYLFGCSSIEVVQLNDSNIEEIKNSEIFSVLTKDYNIYDLIIQGINPNPKSEIVF